MSELMLQGELKWASLSSVLQLIEAEGHSAVLEVAGHTLAFREGTLITAEGPQVSGLHAVRSTFLVLSGAFTVSTLASPPQGDPVGPTMGLLMDGLRLRDEWKRLAPRRLVLREGATVEDPLIQGIVGSLNGQVSVFDAWRVSGLPAAKIVDPLLALVEKGQLKQAAPEDESVIQKLTDFGSSPAIRPMISLSFFDLLDKFREALRARDFLVARQCLEEANKQRPNDRAVQQNLRRLDQIEAKYN